MALWRLELGLCKECSRHGQFYHTNRRQTQLYCKVCEPVVERREIDHAIKVLIDKGVTAEMFATYMAKLSTKESK